MSTIILNLIMINLIVVAIVDKTDFPDSAKKAISFILTKGKIVTSKYRFHLADCSLCLVFWLSLIYILCIGQFCIPTIALCIINALATTLMNPTIDIIMDVYKTLINIIQCILTKINRLLL